MEVSTFYSSEIPKGALLVWLYGGNQDLEGVPDAQRRYLARKAEKGVALSLVDFVEPAILGVVLPKEKETHQRKEDTRVLGAEVLRWARREKVSHLHLSAPQNKASDLLGLAEGLLLANYKYPKQAQKVNKLPAPISISLGHPEISEVEWRFLIQETDAVKWAKDLVNTPGNLLHASHLAQAFKSLQALPNTSVHIFEGEELTSLGMGGLEAVNSGSEQPPTFTRIEYRPPNTYNDKPIVLVGKGVCYDSGGLSLKPTEQMEFMKADMAGAAAIGGVFKVVAGQALPLWIIGLIPATDNRVGSGALAPGDVITMHNQRTVEVLNTDAEGRLILADALSYAQQYAPELVIDIATLTGAAARILGSHGTVYMGEASQEYCSKLEEAGNETHEKVWRLPLWKDFAKSLSSPVAHMSNIGSAEGGAIIAGLFLKRFTQYPWLHLDIAGSAWLKRAETYKGKYATGVGVRLLVAFLKKIVEDYSL